MKPTIYFVLHGLLNGEHDVRAITTEGRQEADGWYYLFDGEANGHGPHLSRKEAETWADYASGLTTIDHV